MEELGSKTKMDENTGCDGSGSDTIKVCICIFEVPKIYVVFKIILKK